MKKYFGTIVTVGIIVGMLQGYLPKQNVQSNGSEKIIEVPSVTQEEKNDDEVILDGEEVTFLPYDEVDYREYEQEKQDDVNNFVNDFVYCNFVDAKNNIENLYQNGMVSDQIKNLGTDLNEVDTQFVDSQMWCIYQNLCAYVDAYNQRDVNTCYEIGKNLCDNYNATLCKDYLYNILVSKKLPYDYQSAISIDANHNIFDGSGNIVLQNGGRLRLIGCDDDDILCNEPSYSDKFDEMYQKSEWYKNLPKVILNRYSSVNNNLQDDGVCYVWNESNVEKTCSREWYSIKEDGSAIYGFDPKDTKITWADQANTYVYESQDGYVFGPLDYTNNCQVDQLYYVQDALVSHCSDVFFLDSCIDNMISEQDAKGYVR